MKITPTKVPGVFIIDIEYTADERGFFARTWDEKKGLDNGMPSSHMVQFSTSYNPHKGTLRGMHYQESPYAEAKVVRCTQGAIYDVAIDLRKDSPAYGQWAAIELSAENRRSFYIPEGCAHGFQTLSDDSEVSYMMSEYFYPEAGRGVRYNDPAFKIEWPYNPTRISERDASWPDWKQA